ncbi:hypothetical protein Tco_1383327 [Tanacetum coccineum]
MSGGSKECPPILALGNYAQWSSWFMRYIDTRLNKDQLRQCIEKSPYILTQLVTLEVPVEGHELGQPHVNWKKGKEVVKPPSPPSESAYEEDTNEERAQRDKQLLEKASRHRVRSRHVLGALLSILRLWVATIIGCWIVCGEIRPYLEVAPPEVPVKGDEPGQPRVVREETYVNTTPENKNFVDAKAEAIHMILSRIGNDIYSTMDACPTAREMWFAIERMHQGDSINIQDVKTKLFWEFGKFTSRVGESIKSYYTRVYRMMNEMARNKLKADTMQVNVQFLQQLQPEWSRFVTIVKNQQDLDTFSFHKLFDILKQHQNKVNEICAERIAKYANSLILVAAAQHYQDDYTQAPKP